MIPKEILEYHVQALIQLACRSGAGEARRISAKDIRVRDELARFCRDSQCDQYGLAAGCPPHVSGPAGFRDLQAEYTEAVVIKIDVPAGMLFSDERRGIMQLLHEIVAAVEQAAVRMGYKRSRGFAGGSCKPLFCFEEADCRVVYGRGGCRHPQSARPSMSGFGIDVGELMRTAGWSGEKADPEADSKMTWVAGLVLIG
ncbi:MAG: DUF2284 domain-containing protein [Thermodesulfobacteriota bacterium]